MQPYKHKHVLPRRCNPSLYGMCDMDTYKHKRVCAARAVRTEAARAVCMCDMDTYKHKRVCAAYAARAVRIEAARAVKHAHIQTQTRVLLRR